MMDLFIKMCLRENMNVCLDFPNPELYLPLFLLCTLIILITLVVDVRRIVRTDGI